MSNQTIKILREPTKPYKKGSARDLWWMQTKKFDGKKVKEFNADLGQLGKADSGQLGKTEPCSGWLVFFEKDGLIELIEDTKTDE